MLATLKDAEDTMARMRGAQTGRLVVGMVTTAADFLPRMLSGFLREHPGVEVQLTIGNRRSLVELLHRNEVDLAVMGSPPRELDTRAEPFAAHPITAFASPAHPLVGQPHLPPKVLANERFIVREDGSGTRAAMEVFFRTHRISPHYAMEVASNEAVKHAVSAGLGVAFLSMHTVRLALSAGNSRRSTWTACRSCAPGTWCSCVRARSRPRPKRSATRSSRTASASWASCSAGSPAASHCG